MNVEYLLQLLNNRLNALNTAKEQSFLTGDLERINTLDSEINGVVDTINKLKLLEGISQTAMVTSYTETEIVQNGIEASFGVNKIFDKGDSDCLLGYDISSYATDPLHEEKIADILKYIDIMDTPEKIDAYIDSEAINSPVKGYMVLNSANKWNVDIRLMLALMELDSRFGTAGIAIRTMNPGNVGNNDEGETRTYASWDEGVEAVAIWLNNHRVDNYQEENKEKEEDISEEENSASGLDGDLQEVVVPVEDISNNKTEEKDIITEEANNGPISRSIKQKRKIV